MSKCMRMQVRAGVGGAHLVLQGRGGARAREPLGLGAPAEGQPVLHSNLQRQQHVAAQACCDRLKRVPHWGGGDARHRGGDTILQLFDVQPTHEMPSRVWWVHHFKYEGGQKQ